MAKRYSKAAHAKRHKQTSHKIKNVIILIFAGRLSGLAVHFGTQHGRCRRLTPLKALPVKSFGHR